MQILGKKSKVLLTALCAVMLIAVGISFAAWDGSAVKADSGNMSDYANAKVGDIVTFGQYYQNNEKVEIDGVMQYEKTPLEWLVVDKNERTGELTLMTKYIVACGSYFGNYYLNKDGAWGWHYGNNTELSGNPYNQAYCDSTVRAYLNNTERHDMGGDQFVAPKASEDETPAVVGGYVPSGKDSTAATGLLTSVGFSNQRYWTGLTTDTYSAYLSTPGFVKREDANNTQLYYQRPLTDAAYTNRPATKGFYDEAFTDEQKAKIVPKKIAGYTGNRWPDNAHDTYVKSYVEGAVDKVWTPSATELNAMNGHDWNGNANDEWTNPSDEASSSVFEFFKNFGVYKNPFHDRNNTSLEDALKARRTALAKNGVQGNYSVPVYNKGNSAQVLTVNDDIGAGNTSDHYWTRSPMSYYYDSVRIIYGGTGQFGYTSGGTGHSTVGTRPCIILQY